MYHEMSGFPLFFDHFFKGHWGEIKKKKKKFQDIFIDSAKKNEENLT